MKLSAAILWVVLFSVGCAGPGQRSGQGQAGAGKSVPTIELTGRLVQSATATNELEFKTEAGVTHPLLRNIAALPLFEDTNLLSRTLILKGWIEPRTGVFGVTGKLQSLKDGQRCEIYYYCDICSITSSQPGPCMCCGAPMKLVEKPE